MKKGFSIAGMVSGAVLIVVGLYMVFLFDGFGGSWTTSSAFGGDFYTYEYEATQNAANNVYSLGHFMNDAFRMCGLVTVCIGTAVLSFFGCKFDETEPQKKMQNTGALLPNGMKALWKSEGKASVHTKAQMETNANQPKESTAEGGSVKINPRQISPAETDAQEVKER